MYIVWLVGIQVIVFLCQARESEGAIQNDDLKHVSSIARHENYQNVQALTKMLEEYDRNKLRNMSDLWQSIKNSAKNAWEYIKQLTNSTKEKVDTLIQELKEKAEELKEKFKEQIKKLQDNMVKLIEEAVGASQALKRCLKTEQESIDMIAKEIISNVTVCISENITRLSPLQRQQIVAIDEKEFMDEVENQLTACINEDVDEECLYKVRENLFKNIDGIEREAFRNELETRNIASDILNMIISCSIEGLIGATNDITKEAVKIVKCVSESENEGKDLKMSALITGNMRQKYLRI